MYAMSRDQWWEFASSGTKTGKVGVVRADGSAQVAPIWFVLDHEGDDDYVIFNTGADSLKGKSLRRDPRFSMCVDDENPPYSFVTFTVEAELSEDVDAMLPWSIRIGTRYMGDEAGEAFGKRNAVLGELLVRGRITRVIANADLTA